MIPRRTWVSARPMPGRGDTNIAIKEFKAAIDKKWDFYDAYAEMGYAYADMGEIDTAQGISEFLEQKAPELADLLSRYIYKADPPKIVMAYCGQHVPALSARPYGGIGPRQ